MPRTGHVGCGKRLVGAAVRESTDSTRLAIYNRIAQDNNLPYSRSMLWPWSQHYGKVNTQNEVHAEAEMAR